MEEDEGQRVYDEQGGGCERDCNGDGDCQSLLIGHGCDWDEIEDQKIIRTRIGSRPAGRQAEI